MVMGLVSIGSSSLGTLWRSSISRFTFSAVWLPIMRISKMVANCVTTKKRSGKKLKYPSSINKKNRRDSKLYIIMWIDSYSTRRWLFSLEISYRIISMSDVSMKLLSMCIIRVRNPLLSFDVRHKCLLSHLTCFSSSLHLTRSINN